MGLTISQIRRSLRLLPISQEPPSPETAASGRRSHRRTGWTLWRDRRPDAFHMGRRAPVHDQAAAPAKADWSRKLARPLALDNGTKLRRCRRASTDGHGTKGAEAVSEGRGRRDSRGRSSGQASTDADPERTIADSQDTSFRLCKRSGLTASLLRQHQRIDCLRIAWLRRCATREEAMAAFRSAFDRASRREPLCERVSASATPDTDQCLARLPAIGPSYRTSCGVARAECFSVGRVGL